MDAFLLLLTLITSLACIAYCLWLMASVLTLKSVPPFVRTRAGAVPAIIEVFGPLPGGSRLYELGSGDLRVLSALARANPAATCIGIEKYLAPYLLGRIRMSVERLPNVTSIRNDLRLADLSSATHVYTYLYREVLDALLPALERSLPKGTVLVSLDFPFSHKEPTEVRRILVKNGSLKQILYRYEF